MAAVASEANLTKQITIIMPRINKHIEIVCSNKSGLSSMSQPSRDAVLAILTKHFAKARITVIKGRSDLEALVSRKPDLVFLGMKFMPLDPTPGYSGPDKIWITDYLDKQGIAYTGSGQAAHKLELNKPLAKQRMLDVGLRTSPFYVMIQNQPLVKDNEEISFPLFVKPTNRGGGTGIDSNSVVNSFAKLRAKVQSIALALKEDSLVEKYLSGREFSVAILKDEHSAEFLTMPIELIAEQDQQGSRLLSEHVKSSNTESVLEIKDEIIKSKVCALALGAFHALGAQDYGRIDIRMDEFGTPHFLEANLLPSLIDGYGSFPKACNVNQHIGHESMVMTIVNLALARHPA